MVQKASRKADASRGVGGSIGKKAKNAAVVLRTRGATGRVVSIAITDGRAPRNEELVKEETPAKNTRAKSPTTDVVKKKKGSETAVKSARGSALKTKREEAPTLSAKTQIAENIATNDPTLRKLRFPKLPKPSVPRVTHGRMRAVAYTGVTYVLLGVLSASYALADISGVVALFGEGKKHHATVLESTSGTLTTTSSGSGDGTSGSTNTSSGSGSGSTDASNTSDSTRGTEAEENDASTVNDTSVTTTDATSSGTANTTSTNTDSPTDTSGTSGFSTINTASIAPPIEVSFSASQPFREKVYLVIKVRNAERVELGLVPRTGLTFLYLGRAQQTTGTVDEWRFAWDTKNIPNGEYDLRVHVKNRYGDYNNPPLFVRVLNAIAPTATTSVPSTITPTVTSIEDEMETTITTLLTDEEDEAQIGDESEMTDAAAALLPGTTPLTAPTAAIAPTPASLLETDDAQETLLREEEEWARRAEQLKRATEEFKKGLLTLIERFAISYRAHDETAKTYVLDEIDSLKTQVVESIRAKELVRDGNYDVVAQEFSKLIAQEIARIETREKMIVERVGDMVSVDSDEDGVVDYDEVHLYKTDPTRADSDGDGFPDGAELVGGYNPTDPSGEVAVAFESPIEAGPLREDILSVESIATERTENEQLGARLSGKGLPNSYVRLYIFSTPVVVTVQTDADGSWSYIFDKELEDGEHTVYVGVTDNAGRIVAKSKPFPFVKTAEAFSAGVAENVPPTSPVIESDQMLSSGAMLLLAAFTLIMCGLALVALGAYFMRPKEHELLGAAPLPA